MSRCLLAIAMLTAICRVCTGASFTLAELENALENDPNNKALVLEIARRYHKRILASTNEAEWARAKRYFGLLADKFRLRSKTGRIEPLPLALYGSYCTLRGYWLGKRSRIHKRAQAFLVRQGISDLDRAVKLAPKDLEIRHIRALSAYYSPPKSGRMRVALIDIQFIVTACRKNPEPCEKFNMAQLYLMGGKAASLVREFIIAEAFLRVLCARFAQTPQAREAREILVKIEPLARQEQARIPQPKRPDPGP